jgi:hypothetical protein
MSLNFTRKIPTQAKAPSITSVGYVLLSWIYKYFIFKAKWPPHTTYRHCLDTSCFHRYSYYDCFGVYFRRLCATSWNVTTMQTNISFANIPFVISLQISTGSESSKSLRVPQFLDNRHMKVVTLSVLRTGRLYPPGHAPGTNFWLTGPQDRNLSG